MPPTSDSEPDQNGDSARLPYPMLVGAATTLVLTALVLAAFPPRYETNDDAGMHLIAAGVAHVSEPDEHLVFTNVAVGYPLSRLYRVAPNVPWYGLYQLSIVTSAAIAIGVLFLRLNPTWKQLILLCVHFCAAVAPCLVSIQFTKTAFLASEAGILVLLGPLLGDGLSSRWWLTAGVLLALLGACIRLDAFLLALAATAPIVGYAAWNRSPRPCKQTLSTLLVVGVCAILLQAAHRGYYAASPEWNEFLEFNGCRHQIVVGNESLRYDASTQPLFDEVGWSPEDYMMLKSWFCADPDIYSTARLKQFLQSAPQFSSPHMELAMTLERIDPGPGTLWLWMILASSLLIASGRTARIAIVAMAAYGFALALGVSFYFQHLPDRVLFCLFLPAAVVGGLLSRGGFTAPGDGFEGLLQRAGVLAALIAVICAAISWGERWKSRLAFEEYAATIVRQLDPQPSQLFVIWGDAFSPEYLVCPLGSLDAMRPFRCLGVGWGLRSPIANRRLAEFSIDNLAQALTRRDDVFLVCRRTQLPLLGAYVELHDGDTIEARLIHLDEYGFGDVVQLRRAARDVVVPGTRTP